MISSKQWDVAYAQLDALRRNLPHEVDENRVTEFHSILHTLQIVLADDALEQFRIPAAEMKHRVVSWIPGNARRAPRTNYSQQAYCDRGFFARQVLGLWSFINRIPLAPSAPRVSNDISDYWRMSDAHLQMLASQFNIPTDPSERASHVPFDRSRVIDELLKRDDALRRAKAASPQVVHIGNIVGSGNYASGVVATAPEEQEDQSLPIAQLQPNWSGTWWGTSIILVITGVVVGLVLWAFNGYESKRSGVTPSNPATTGTLQSTSEGASTTVPGIWFGTDTRSTPLYYEFAEHGSVLLRQRLDDPHPARLPNVRWRRASDTLVMEWFYRGKVVDTYVGKIFADQIVGRPSAADSKFPSDLDRIAK